MGTTLSSCGNECGRRCDEFERRWHSNDSSYRFSAEVYRLSEDQQQWIKVHPEVLSIRVNPAATSAADGNGDGVNQGGRRGIALLEAATLDHQTSPSSGNEQQPNSTILSLSIPQGTQLKRYTEKFVYWRHGKSAKQQVFALNLVSPSDLDHFCAAIQCLPPTPFMGPKIGAGRDEQVFHAHMAPLMALHRGHVEQNPIPLFTKCAIWLRDGHHIQLVDGHGELLARANTVECIFSLPPILHSSGPPSSSPQQQHHQLAVSFPARALLLQFPSPAQQLAFCRRALNVSSARMAGTNEPETIRHFLQSRMAALDTLLDQLNTSDNHNAADVGGHHPPSSPANVLIHDELRRQSSSTGRRQSMAALLRSALNTRLVSLEEKGDDEKLANALQSTTSIHSPASSSSSHQKGLPLPFFLHRLHLHSILNCNFSLQKTIGLLGQCAAKNSGQQQNGEAAGMGQKKEEQDGGGNFVEIKLAEPPAANTNASRMCRIMLELLQSERAFVNDLHTLLTRFVLPSGLQFMQCVRQLHRIHSLFLRSLQSTLNPLLITMENDEAISYDADIRPILFRLFSLIIAKCAQFKVYSEYTFAHMHFQQLRSENAAFTEMITAFCTSIGDIRAIDSLLIKPVQRLLKYPLFVGQLRELCPEGSDERALSVKALKQLRTLANWLNEMQRIQEDYGPELLAISTAPQSCSAVISSHHHLWHFADLNSLQLFAHVRWLNPPSSLLQPKREVGSDGTTGVCPLNCALFVFCPALVIMERKRGGGQQHDRENKRLSPLVLPVAQIQLLIQQKGTDGAPINDDPEISTGPVGVEPNFSRFALALRTRTADGDGNLAPMPVNSQVQIQQQAIYHFECCHPEVCHRLEAAIDRQRKPGMMPNGDKNNDDEEAKLRGQPETVMMTSWRMEASVDSSCSSSSDRGYSSGGAPS